MLLYVFDREQNLRLQIPITNVITVTYTCMNISQLSLKTDNRATDTGHFYAKIITQTMVPWNTPHFEQR